MHRSISGLYGGDSTNYTDTHIWPESHRSSMLFRRDLDRFGLGHESVRYFVKIAHEIVLTTSSHHSGPLNLRYEWGSAWPGPSSSPQSRITRRKFTKEVIYSYPPPEAQLSLTMLIQ